MLCTTSWGWAAFATNLRRAWARICSLVSPRPRRQQQYTYRASSNSRARVWWWHTDIHGGPRGGPRAGGGPVARGAVLRRSRRTLPPRLLQGRRLGRGLPRGGHRRVSRPGPEVLRAGRLRSVRAPLPDHRLELSKYRDHVEAGGARLLPARARDADTPRRAVRRSVPRPRRGLRDGLPDGGAGGAAGQRGRSWRRPGHRRRGDARAARAGELRRGRPRFAREIPARGRVASAEEEGRVPVRLRGRVRAARARGALRPPRARRAPRRAGRRDGHAAPGVPHDPARPAGAPTRAADGLRGVLRAPDRHAGLRARDAGARDRRLLGRRGRGLPASYSPLHAIDPMSTHRTRSST